MSEAADRWLQDLEDRGLLEWLPDPKWTTEPSIIAEKVCRQKHCQQPAVAAFNRSRRPSHPVWWCYCDTPDHLYSRRIVDGVVLMWHRIRQEAPG